MQSRSGGGNCSGIDGVNCLITFSIRGQCAALDVGRQWDDTALSNDFCCGTVKADGEDTFF